MTKTLLLTSALLVATVLAAPALPAHAQGNEVTIEASVFRGAVGYARQRSPTTLLGIEAGVGVPQIDLSLEPPESDLEGDPGFEEYVHVALLTRFKPSGRFEVDAGLRGSIADLWGCGASDCWPALFGGAYIQPMVGWSRFKIGARVTAGWIGESKEGGSDGSTFVVGLAPLLVRLTIPR